MLLAIERISYMSGHSHWAGIKHKKGLVDAKRGKLFSKLAKNIMIALREGGPDVDTNLRLRYAIDKAKEANMPKTNIERAIKKASGEGEGVNFVELTYEGYGPGGIAIMIEIVTDNRNRTASEVRKIFENGGGKMGESGCVSYFFEKKGLLAVPVAGTNEEDLLEIILEAGAENMSQQEEMFEITTNPTDFHAVRNSLSQAGLKVEVAELVQLPQNTIELDEETGRKVLNLINALEDHDDIQNVYANYDLPETLLNESEA